MDLKRKLERLAASGRAPGLTLEPPRFTPPEPPGASRQSQDDAAAPGRDDESPPAAGGEGFEPPDPLKDLRARMQAILGRRSPAASTPASLAKRAASDLSSLPFLTEERPEGSLCRRYERLPASYHVGRMPVDAARGACPELLALLALDPSLSQVSLERALYFDTETTGLGVGTGTVAFLIGLGLFEPSGASEPAPFFLEQLFLRGPADEPAALAWFRDRVEASSVLVSYNGKSFDWPLICDRFAMHRMTQPPDRPHLDLLHVGRRLHRARIGACRLKSLESEVLGFVREGDVEGAEIAPRYAHYLRTGDEEALRAVVEHNLWDVASMAALVGLYGEPLEVLHPLDLLGVARTFQRGRRLDDAASVTEHALLRGCGLPGLELRARIAKAQGDRAKALSDFEALLREVDDGDVRLELAKLYEHYAQDPERALSLVEAGTSELPAPAEKRRARLAKKIERRSARAGRKVATATKAPEPEIAPRVARK